MKRYERKFSEAVSKNNFIKAVNSYVEDNYTDKDLKIIQNYKSIQGIDKNMGHILYRGLFLNGLSNAQIREYFSMKFIEDKGMSWTHSYSEAMSFAYGSNIFSSNKKLAPNQLGIVIQSSFSLNDIIIDFNYILKNNTYPELEVIEEDEVLVKIKKRNCKIIALVSDVGVKKIR